MRLKLKLVYLPFLLLSTGYLIAYSFIDWLFVIHPGYLSDNNVIEITVAVVLVWIPAFFILWPRIKLLNVEAAAGQRRFDHQNYFFVAVMLVLVPTIFAQRYLVIAFDRLTRVANVQAVNYDSRTRYYKIKNWSFDKKLIGTSFEVTFKLQRGQHTPEELHLNMYLAAPFITNPNANNVLAKKWFVRVFHKQISNWLTNDEKKEEIAGFKNRAYTEFVSTVPEKLSYMIQLGNNINRSMYLKAIEQVSSVTTPMVIEGETESFDSRNDGNLAASIVTYLLGLLIWFGILCLKELNEVV